MTHIGEVQTAGGLHVMKISAVEFRLLLTYASSVSRYQQTPPLHASVNLVYNRKHQHYAEENRTEFIAHWQIRSI